MLGEKACREIEEMEKAGLNVTVIGSGGTFDYSTQKFSSNCYCNNCNHFRLLPDPDHDDWFRSGDKKAVCLKLKAVIRGSLETPAEYSILRPLYCPKLGRELSEKEKMVAKEDLAFRQSLFKK